jgi:hypothetical protein
MKGSTRYNEVLSILALALFSSQDCQGFAFSPAKVLRPAWTVCSMSTTKITEFATVAKTPSREIESAFEDMMRESAPKYSVYGKSLITEDEVLGMHKAWGDGLISIAKTFDEKGYEAAKVVAQNVLDAAYGYAKGIPVLFKPTLASGSQTFRLTNEGALSYFVGGNEKYPNDGGFAIQGWRKVESFPAGILLLGNVAISMGNVHCTNKDGKTTIVDKTWAYKKDDEGNVRIILHHSSLPYNPATKASPPPAIITEEEVLAMHKAWGDGLVTIAKTFDEQGYDAAKEVAQSVLDAAYGYAKNIPVLFKPTLASGEQTFRLNNEGALSYFVGGNSAFPSDTGFAIQGWRNVESYPVKILLLGNTALSMGNVICTNKDGKTTMVDKTWGYKKDDEGKLRIVLHHSSLPYSA